MRTWLFHPLIFYPLALLLAGLLIAVSLRPQSWPREAAPVAGQVTQGALILTGEAFSTPESSADQHLTVIRDFMGRAQTLRIAVKANQPPPAPADHGVRILLNRDQAQMLDGRPVAVEVTYNPSPVNAATGLAISVQGSGPATWSTRPVAPQPGTLMFDLPPQQSVTGLGLRAISSDGDEAYGLEITRIRVIPHA